MGPLTRNDWIEMFNSIKVIEFNTREIRSIGNQLGPSIKGQIKGLALSNQQEIDKIKSQIQHVIGQVE